MANQLNKGDTFVDGQTVNASRLNNLVDLATALEGMISVQSPVTAAGTDYVYILRPGSPNVLRKALVSTLPSAGVTDVTAAASPFFINLVATTPTTGVRLLTLSFDTQGPNTVLAGSASGASTAPLFRALVPADLPTSTVTILASAIDWNQGNTFYQSVNVSRAFTFSNLSPGQTIRVVLLQSGGGSATWPGTVKWRGGAAPALTTSSGHTDIYTFTTLGVTVLGHSDKDYF